MAHFLFMPSLPVLSQPNVLLWHHVPAKTAEMLNHSFRSGIMLRPCADVLLLCLCVHGCLCVFSFSPQRDARRLLPLLAFGHPEGLALILSTADWFQSPAYGASELCLNQPLCCVLLCFSKSFRCEAEGVSCRFLLGILFLLFFG